MPNLALADLIIPYLLKGDNLGANHAALSAIRVISYETASDNFGMVIRGKAEINGQALIDVRGGRLQIAAATAEAAPPFDPSRKDPIFDIRETVIEFELFVPRDGSAIIAQAATSITAAGFNPVRNVLNALDTLPINAAPSDYPSSAFTFDFIIQAPSIRPPFLHPAKMTDRGLLVPDPAFQEVKIHLPKLRFRLTHGNPLNSRLTFDILSAGVAGLDDPGDIGVAEMVSMEPPYAFIGGVNDRVVGFGFRKAVLDLSNGSTPPDIIEKFGFGDDWSGLYLPEARIFIAPEGAKDLALEAGVEDLLIGFGPSAGVSGDFEVALINQGQGELKLDARFFDENGKAYGIERQSPITGRVALPAKTRVVIDVQGGMPPYDPVTLKVGSGAAQNGRLFNLDLTSGPQTLVIHAEDSSPGADKKTATLTVEAIKQAVQNTLPAPGSQPTGPLVAVIDPPANGTPRIIITAQTDTAVTLTTDPADLNVMWSLIGTPGETGPAPSFTVPVAPGTNVTVKARLPGSTVPTSVSFYYYFDEPKPVPPANEDAQLGAYGATSDNLWTTKANSKLRADGRTPGGQAPLIAYDDVFRNRVPNLSPITIKGQVSYEGDGSTSKRDYNYALARRRAIAVREVLESAYGNKNFSFTIDPTPRNPSDYANLASWTAEWQGHGAPNDRDFWRADVTLPNGLSQPEKNSNATLKRPAAPPVPVIIPPVDPTPATPPPPKWFRSAKVKVRLFKDVLVALEVEAEIDFQTAAEERINASGQPSGTPANVGTLNSGAPLAPDNPADGITKFRILCQSDQATGRITTLMQIGADPADKDGLLYAGWMPGQTPNPNKDIWLTLLGSYISFWPLLVDMSGGNKGAVADAILTGAALAIPAVVAALPWFRVERVILFGIEYLQREQGGELESFLLFDVEADWSAKISIFGIDLLEIDAAQPLAVRYKAIGLRLGTYDEQGNEGFSFRPVFDASKGYTIDISKGGSLKVAPPFDKILKILAARLSRTNPLTFEIDLGVGVDLGVVTIDRARVRVYLDEPRLPELTAFGASIDVPGAIAGKGYLEMSAGDEPGTSKIGGQIDVTIRPVGLRVAAAFEIADVKDGDKTVTAVYVGLNVVLPVGIPLGSSGLGLFGFRGIFGMHYQRNTDLGNSAAAPALRWLEASGGQPHLLKHNNQVLWKPKANEWAFGVGALLGTMEGGILMNLDGTLLIELPGPRVLIVMNARIISPPPSMDGMGASGGIMAVIEITPDHFLIGIIVQYEIEDLIKIRIPVEAYFDFVDVTNWHFYLGQRKDPIEVDVLGIVKGTGYFMVRGNGLEALPEKNLPAIEGFALGLGAAASITFGDVDSGLYLKIGGSMDAVIGFDPFILAGNFQLYGKLRLWIISIGASATLDVIVIDKGGIKMKATGEACGHIDLFFFELEGCVSVTIGGFNDKPDMPVLVDKLAVKSRSPALLAGTGVDRPIDTSLGDGIQGDNAPAMNDPALISVPIDSIPVISMVMTPQADGLQFMGQNVSGSSGLSGDANAYVQRGKEEYQYKVTDVKLERQGGGDVIYGSDTPATWWTQTEPTKKSPLAQLALFTYEPEPASKAIEKTECRKESIKDRWGTVCNDAAEPASVLWTFLLEKLGASYVGWDLEGEAWPDKPGTKRSRPPELGLMVNEKWRTGNKTIDNMRGIIPAIVVGSRFECRKEGTPTTPVPRLTAPRGTTVAAAARGLNLARRADTAAVPLSAAVASLQKLKPGFIFSMERAEKLLGSIRLTEKLKNLEPIPQIPLDPVSVIARLANGDAVSRYEAVASLFAIPDASKQSTTGNCETKVLQAPMLDNGEIIVMGDKSNRGTVKQYLDKFGFKHGPLNNVVVVHTNGIEHALVLLYVYRRYLEQKRVVLRALDEHENELWSYGVSAADMLGNVDLPPRWTDASGPWAEEVEDVLGWSHDPRCSGYVPVLVKIKGFKETDRIEIGNLPFEDDITSKTRKGVLRPSFFLAAIEALRVSEMERSDWDEHEITKDREAITKVLGPAGSDDALLVPASLYKVSVTWDGKRKGDGATASRTQSFWFKTDDQAPTSLDPWVLMSTPFEGEAHAFGAEPLHLVFNTHDVDRLYDAYNKELRIRITASSANHPKPANPNDLVVSAQLGTLKGVGAGILSPWEESLVEALTETKSICIPVDEDRSRQSAMEIKIPLDPYTDYKFDVEMVDKGAAQDASGVRVYRRSFSTGAYGKLSEMANDLQAVSVQHRAVPLGGMETIRARFATKGPQGAELDDAFRDIGLDAIEPPPIPRVTVFWEQNGNAAPQPTAIFIDTPEPLWRARPFPKQITDDTAAGNAQRWVMDNRECLKVERKPGSADIIASIIRAPGDQRALVILKANSRSQRVQLDLLRPAVAEVYLPSAEQRFTVVDIPLTKALWEE
jgi:hypothetical protein